jgi:hypothetical protein
MTGSEQATKNGLANLIGYGLVDAPSPESGDFKLSFQTEARHMAPKFGNIQGGDIA